MKKMTLSRGTGRRRSCGTEELRRTFTFSRLAHRIADLRKICPLAALEVAMAAYLMTHFAGGTNEFNVPAGWIMSATNRSILSQLVILTFVYSLVCKEVKMNEFSRLAAPAKAFLLRSIKRLDSLKWILSSIKVLIDFVAVLGGKNLVNETADSVFYLLMMGMLIWNNRDKVINSLKGSKRLVRKVVKIGLMSR